jgi:hypothetical protein
MALAENSQILSVVALSRSFGIDPRNESLPDCLMPTMAVSDTIYC